MHDGILLLNKQAGLTSFSSLNVVKRMLGRKVKVGHSGTLDLFAEGLLVVLLGSATKLNTQFSNFDKKYQFTMQFGTETDTLDPEGEVIATKNLPNASNLQDVIKSFIGKQLQEPPKYSAIHVDGKRASDRMRSGEVFEIKKREITMYNIEIKDMVLENNSLKELELVICCSKGTYVRSLCRDIAYAMGSVAFVKRLKRLAVGTYTVDENWQFKLEKSVEPSKLDLKNHLVPIYKIGSLLNDWQTICVKDENIINVRRGNTIDINWLDSKVLKDRIVLVDNQNNFLACIEKIDNEYKYLVVNAR